MKTILIADDDRRLRKGISSLLKKRGFRIIEIVNITPLTEFENPLDIVIISLETLLVSKEWLLAQLKELVTKNALPIITTIGEHKEIIKELDGYREVQVIEKPFSFKELMERIDTHLKTSKMTAAVVSGREE